MTSDGTFMNSGFQQKAGSLAEYALYAIVALLPWQARWIISPQTLNGAFWEYATVSVYVVDVLLALVLVFVVLTGTVGYLRHQRNGLAGILVLGAYVMFSIAFSSYTMTHAYGSLLALSGLLFAVLLMLVQWDRRRLLIAFVVGACWSALLGAGQFALGAVSESTLFGIAEQMPITLGVSVVESGGVRLLRAYGSLSHPNIFGGFLALSVLASLTLLGYEHRKIPRYLLIGVISFLTFAMVLSFSRSALLGLLIGLFVAGIAMIFFQRESTERYTIGFAAVIITLCALFILASDELYSRTGDSAIELQSITERITSLSIARELFLGHIIFGTGFGAYTEAAATLDAFTKPAWAYQPMHNVDLLLLVELGTIGVIVLTILLVVYIRYFFRQPFTGERAMMLAMLVLYAVVAIFDHYPVTNHFGLLLTVLVFSLGKASIKADR